MSSFEILVKAGTIFFLEMFLCFLVTGFLNYCILLKGGKRRNYYGVNFKSFFVATVAAVAVIYSCRNFPGEEVFFIFPAYLGILFGFILSEPKRWPFPKKY